MPTISGKDIISESTEKTIRRLNAVSAITILVKLYNVPLNDLKIFGVELPFGLFDTVAIGLIVCYLCSFIIKWYGDMAAYRLWFSENSGESDFGTNIHLDASFLSGGTELLLKLYMLEKNQGWPSTYEAMPDDIKKDFNDYKTNVKLYISRLESVGKQFKTLSLFCKYYVWVQCFVFPILAVVIALYTLFKYGTFSLPNIH